jgi:hypothetical protein
MEPHIFYPSRVKVLRDLVGSIGLVAIGVWMLAQGLKIAWVAVAFFGMCTFTFMTLMLPNNSYLRIGPEGFEIRSLFRSYSYRWTEVAYFGVSRVGRFAGRKVVVFNFADDFSGKSMMRRVAAGLCGWEGGIPEVYAISAESLAELLNTYKTASEPSSGRA